ncbi:dihydrodipicolinate synthase family protein [Devosia algicola]|uniref:Dihydrodipicolinate synthase family protein n=1 Tax=Devosia algicola TaxID=3026418 RepID=A0ABY7YML1_9HYPH|nr:dihydrodipicolinate synthase family protein [Devosia algicola]WDR02175.1 dihydrodipicolinate synthase family protein [Devosia algicola]
MTSAATLTHGVYPILYALFNANGQLWREGMRRQMAYCLEMKVAGIATLGLATEVRNLSATERRTVLEWNLEDIAGRVPLAVTIFAPTADQQRDDLSAAAAAGADWAIIQPPTEARDSDDLMRLFSKLIDHAALPVAIQNAPAFVGVGLDPVQLAELARRHPNLVGVKQEVSAVDTAALRDMLGDRLSIFSGRGGLEPCRRIAGRYSWPHSRTRICGPSNRHLALGRCRQDR